MTNTVNNAARSYATVGRAKRETGKRSLFAHLFGKCSQYEVRTDGTVYVGGLSGELARTHGGMRVVAQYSGGYCV